MNRTLTLTVLGWGFVTLAGCGGGTGTGASSKPAPKAAKSLTGGGSTFVEQMMKTWNPAYAKAQGIQVDYSGTGSTNGINAMIDKKNDFGCTDAFMNDEQLKKATAAGGDVLHLPLVMGAVVPIYNLAGVDKPVRFTGPVLADIYLGKIKKWNDPALAKINEGVALPDKDITVVARGDGSGTSFIFTDYLSKASPEWKDKVGTSTAPKWPVGVQQPKNQGVAGQVKNTAGAVGYVELIYALSQGSEIKYGPVQNKAGEFVAGSLDGTTAAAANLKDIPDDLRFSLTDAEGKESYPICGTVWMVLYAKQSPDKAEALSHFARWLMHEGQDMAKDKHYARLPAPLVDKVVKKIETIKGE